MLQTDDNPNGVPQSTFDEMTAGMKKDREHFFKGFFKDFFGTGFISQPVSSEVEMNAWRQTMMAGLRPTLAAAQAFATTDFRPDLKSFDGVPTLVIHGTSDKTVPIDATGRVVAEQVPGAQLIEYDGSAHGLFATDKERLIDNLVAFLSGEQDAASTETRTNEPAY
jgi:pimeloyl-ACP methyl ester carboxylesterase